jgi:cellulose synthase/poly-beta-1,6-N-acetylglucosamine synthase-like glycosyltransferase
VPSGEYAPLKISIIIPARNEEANIGTLLEALVQQSYPKESVEIIVVDDHSEDRTAEIVRKFQSVKLLTLASGSINSYKKKAIETGIGVATGDLIVTTDADCRPPTDWLKTIALFKQSAKAVFIAAPVLIENNSSLVQLFQTMDFMVLQGITGAVVSRKATCMCNGANLAYDRKVFDEVGGFSGVDHIASGDDMLLMHKIWKRYPDEVRYLKARQAIMPTQPVKTWKEFFQQRVRWASKARQYDDKRILPVLFLVYLLNLSFPVLLIAGFWNFNYWLGALLLWLCKTIVETPFFWSVSAFFNREWMTKRLFIFQPLHMFYIVISGLFGQFGKYEWKGRKVR